MGSKEMIGKGIREKGKRIRSSVYHKSRGNMKEDSPH